MDLIVFVILFLLTCLMLLLASYFKTPMFAAFSFLILLYLAFGVMEFGITTTQTIPTTTFNCESSGTWFNCTDSGSTVQTVTTDLFDIPLFKEASGLILLVLSMFSFFKFYQYIVGEGDE